MKAEPCRTKDASTLAAGDYSTGAIGTALANAARMLLFQNLSDKTVWISLDGVNDHFPLMNQGYFVLDIASNKSQSNGFYLAEGDRVYARQLSGAATGYIYVTAFYGA